jgi:hypothetical protein
MRRTRVSNEIQSIHIKEEPTVKPNKRGHSKIDSQENEVESDDNYAEKQKEYSITSTQLVSIWK